jgi:hypothetical protein
MENVEMTSSGTGMDPLQQPFSDLVRKLHDTASDRVEFTIDNRKRFIYGVIGNINILNTPRHMFEDELRQFVTDMDKIMKNDDTLSELKRRAKNIYDYVLSIRPPIVLTGLNLTAFKRRLFRIMDLIFPGNSTGGRRKSRGGCGCMVPQQGGYRATKKDKKYLKMYNQGKSIGFTMRSSLKAKGLIKRANGTKRVSKKYRR